jgi:hypothetical protein
MVIRRRPTSTVSRQECLAKREGEPITKGQMEEVAELFGCHVACMVNLLKFCKHVELPPNTGGKRAEVH